MRSKRSYFNGVIFRTAVKRWWPLWCVYLIALYFLVPAVLTRYSGVGAAYQDILRELADGAVFSYSWDYLVIAACAMGGLTAMCVFGHLYSPRQTALLCAVPVRREAVYLSCFTAGLVPMLGADVLVVLACGGIEAGLGILNVPMLLFLLGILVMLNLAFYGFAAFCAMLTGSVAVLPLVYLVLEVVAAAVMLMVEVIFTALIFGWAGEVWGYWLSPLIQIGSSEPVEWMGDTVAIAAGNIAVLGCYCAAGIVFALLGLALYKRRAMEAAGEVVAVRALRPVFRYCMAFGCGLVLASASCLRTGWMYYRAYTGGAASVALTAALTVLGCAMGWFGAEMLMKKSLRVFRGGKWAGFCITAGILALGAVCAGADAVGYETYIPDTESIQSVYVAVRGEDFQAEDEETVRLVQSFQQLLIDGKADYAQAGETFVRGEAASIAVTVDYTLQDGGVVRRSYRLYDPAVYPALAEGVAALEAVMNTDAAYAGRGIDVPITAETLDVCRVSYSEHIEADASGDVMAAAVSQEFLDAAQAASLYEAIEKDLDAHTIGQFRAFSSTDVVLANISIMFDLYMDTAGYADYHSYPVTTASENTLAWLEENLGIEAG